MNSIPIIVTHSKLAAVEVLAMVLLGEAMQLSHTSCSSMRTKSRSSRKTIDWAWTIARIAATATSTYAWLPPISPNPSKKMGCYLQLFSAAWVWGLAGRILLAWWIGLLSCLPLRTSAACCLCTEGTSACSEAFSCPPATDGQTLCRETLGLDPVNARSPSRLSYLEGSIPKAHLTLADCCNPLLLSCLVSVSFDPALRVCPASAQQLLQGSAFASAQRKIRWDCFLLGKFVGFVSSVYSRTCNQILVFAQNFD